MNSNLIWSEIDLKAISYNVRELRRITSPDSRLMAVVKANGYGHGAVEVALAALKNGASCLGVARMVEGLHLRKAGITAPILILGYTPPEHSATLVSHCLTQTVYTFEAAEALSEAAALLQTRAIVHIKVDTGMGRLGLLPDNPRISLLGKHLPGNAQRVIESISRLPHVEIEGIFTHFATADSRDKTYTRQQLERFLEFLDKLKIHGLEFPLRHAANSAALIDLPETHLDMVRPGISLYGFYPSAEVGKERISLAPAMTFKTRIIHVKMVPAGFHVSYGLTYQTENPTVIATVSAGYADGLNRLLSSRGQMLVRGSRAGIVGRICMDLTLLDVGHIPDVRIGDEVVIFGSQGQECIPVEEMAESLNTIHYEIVTSLSSRVARVFL
ncbi:MAG: alanine racemase [Deltaproteobacteria bacterium]|nr:alanine racemase [Deltaproteobacteria bacterium]